MHEIRTTLPPEFASEAATLALRAGIERVTVTEAYVHGPNAHRSVVSAETSTPKAKAFVDALLSSPVLAGIECTITSREVRAIIGGESAADVTRPMCEPFPDVIQDLYQLSHLTPSYVARAAGGAVMLANGVIENSAIAMVVAALFLPFLSQVLALSFGIWSRDFRLARQGVWTLLSSTALALTAGAAVATLRGGPIQFHDFKGPLGSFAVSAVIGIAAGLSSADDAGRRYLIGVAASVQLAVFPVWLGAACVLGLPERPVIQQRLLSFAINLVTIAVTALLSYAALHLKTGRPRSERASA